MPETKKDRGRADKEINWMNKILEPLMKQQWEFTNGMHRLNLQTTPGRKPQWPWNQKNGKLARGKGPGIDWYRRQTTILLPKLLPFAKQCQAERPGAIIQEDRKGKKHQRLEHCRDYPRMLLGELNGQTRWSPAW
ncbi:uncharacterized protein BDR25DRAFT_329374 [Lindgomyces ingoldianus]|uniref:Uncharacterized protein n=1 Tax=Lindgomyces ingoldianus TaxID=673940 RepID=A0ACB6QAY8_9PLEO|nr:uncharacterized protein BDR25DRAFT_329374 [Lindgomyces ingoldianus]KAF2464094.1 hypothetical protein BDR25DRAFT_329374 [Lindgomyces ingoldianus]